MIYCTDRAMANGFSYASKSDWSNMGQGAPYTGPLPGASPRPEGIDFNDYDCDIHEYAPTVGLKALREAVAVSASGAQSATGGLSAVARDWPDPPPRGP